MKKAISIVISVLLMMMPPDIRLNHPSTICGWWKGDDTKTSLQIYLEHDELRLCKKGACVKQAPFEGGEGENQNFRNQVEM